MTKGQTTACNIFAGIVAAMTLCANASNQLATPPVDPGVRGGAPGAGAALKGLTADETAFFQDGLVRFSQIESVTGGQNNGSGLALTLIVACLAMCSRVSADRALRLTP
jgi:hypothetical protein